MANVITVEFEQKIVGAHRQNHKEPRNRYDQISCSHVLSSLNQTVRVPIIEVSCCFNLALPRDLTRVTSKALDYIVPILNQFGTTGTRTLRLDICLHYLVQDGRNFNATNYNSWALANRNSSLGRLFDGQQFKYCWQREHGCDSGQHQHRHS